MPKQKLLLVPLIVLGLLAVASGKAEADEQIKYARIFQPEWNSVYLFEQGMLKQCSFQSNRNDHLDFSVERNCRTATQLEFDILKPVGCTDHTLTLKIEGLREGEAPQLVQSMEMPFQPGSPDHIKIPFVENGQLNTANLESYFTGPQGMIDTTFERYRLTATCPIASAETEGNSLIITSPQTAAPEFLVPPGWGTISGNQQLTCVNNQVDPLNLSVQVPGKNLPVVVALLREGGNEVVATSSVTLSDEQGKAAFSFSDLNPAPGNYRAVAFFGHEGSRIGPGDIENLLNNPQSLVEKNPGITVTIGACAVIQPGQSLNCQSRNGNQNVQLCNLQPVGNNNSQFVSGQCNSNGNGNVNNNNNNRGRDPNNPFRPNLNRINQVVIGGNQAFSDFNIMRIVWSTTGLYWCNSLENPAGNIRDSVSNLTHQFESCDGASGNLAYKDIRAGMKCRVKPGDDFNANLNINGDVEFYFSTEGANAGFQGILQIAQVNWLEGEFGSDRASFCRQFEGISAPSSEMLFWLNTRNAWTSQGQDLVCDGGVVIQLNQITASDPVIGVYDTTDTSYTIGIANKGGILSHDFPSADMKTTNRMEWTIRGTPEGGVRKNQYSDLANLLSKTLASHDSQLDWLSSSYNALTYHFTFLNQATFRKPEQGFMKNSSEVEKFLKAKLLPQFGFNPRHTDKFWNEIAPQFEQDSDYFIGLIPAREVDTLLPLQVSPLPGRINRVMLYIEKMPGHNKKYEIQAPDLSPWQADPQKQDSTLVEIGALFNS